MLNAVWYRNFKPLILTRPRPSGRDRCVHRCQDGKSQARTDDAVEKIHTETP
jgi:hypothetical protein